LQLRRRRLLQERKFNRAEPYAEPAHRGVMQDGLQGVGDAQLQQRFVRCETMGNDGLMTGGEKLREQLMQRASPPRRKA
jgi:hypothetical protein